MIRSLSVIYVGGGGLLEKPRMRSEGGSQELRNKRRRRWTLFASIIVRARVPEYRKFRRKSAISAGGGGVMRRKRRIDSAVSCTCSKSFEISGYPQAGAE